MDTTVPGRIYFNTDALPERDRFPAYCEEMVRRYAALDIVARNDSSRFRASIELQRAGGVDIGHITTTPSDYERTPYLRDGDDALCIVLCIEGGSYQTQRGNPQRLRAGDGIVCDNAQSGGIHVEGNSRFWVIKAARPSIGALVPRTARFGGARLDRDPVARRLLFGYLGAAHRIDFGGGGGRSHALYDQHIVDLVALAIGAESDVRREAEDRGIASVRRDAILREIERRSGDQTFGVNTVATSLGITPRYVHRLLEETGQSFTHHLLQRRLEAAAALLRDPQWRYRKIAAIAAEAGFTDLSYFNRAFRRHFGVTPSDIRQAAGPLS